ncbi:hypothetical protein O9992_25660 [Vibrio lentus]|nr:hypothetical protein [Vibrio lentus]
MFMAFISSTREMLDSCCSELEASTRQLVPNVVLVSIAAAACCVRC